MTQPCHKNTTLNQQYCDNEHKGRRGGQDTTPPPYFPTHNKHGNTRQKRDGDNTRGAGQCKVPDPIRRQGITAHTTPAIQKGHRVNDKGDANTQTGTPTFDGESVTLPPFPHHATHHSLYHTTIHDGPTLHHDEGGVDRGYPTTRTAQTHTSHPHTTHPAKNSARHDSSTDEYCNEMSRARATPRTGQDSSSTPHRHSTHRRGWTPSTHPLIHSHTVHVHTTNEQQ